MTITNTSTLPIGFDDEPLSAPQRRAAWREARALIELPRLLARAPWLLRAPRGDGQPLLLLPGIGADDRSSAPLRHYLTKIGYDARGWGLGRNGGDVEALVPQVEQLTAAIAAETGQKVTLIGWSLGGVLARETARRQPDLVAQVLTYGTPVVGGPAYTLVGHRYSPETLATITGRIDEVNRTPLQVPLVAFYSRRDGVVNWRASVDRLTEQVEHVEVRSTHVGLGIDPDVWMGIARRLPGTGA